MDLRAFPNFTSSVWNSALRGKDKMSPVRMPAAGSSQVQVSRGSPRVQRQIKMEFDHDGTEIIMPALPFTAQSERQVWLDEAPRGPWPGPKNGGSMRSVTSMLKAWSAKKYDKVTSVKSYKGLESSCILMYEYNGIEVKTNSSSIKLRYMDEHVHSHICQGECRREGG